jgi:hypothetical protein
LWRRAIDSALSAHMIQALMTRSMYTPELGRKICDRVARGQTLEAISTLPGMPGRSAVHRWRRRHPHFGEAYRLALSQRRAVMRRHRSYPDGRRRRALVYSDELADRICHRLLKGWSLSDVARSGMAPMPTLFLWLRRHQTFRLRYGIACFLREQILADQALEAADAGQDSAWIHSRLAAVTPNRWKYW